MYEFKREDLRPKGAAKSAHLHRWLLPAISVFLGFFSTGITQAVLSSLGSDLNALWISVPLAAGLALVTSILFPQYFRAPDKQKNEDHR